MLYRYIFCVFFFKQKTAYEMRISDWSSDVCSSDLRKGRPWTFEDILLVPEVNELALSADGRFAIYSAEIADTGAKRTRAQIRIVDIRARTQRSIADRKSVV